MATIRPTWDLVICRVLDISDGLLSASDLGTKSGERGRSRFSDHSADATWLDGHVAVSSLVFGESDDPPDPLSVRRLIRASAASGFVVVAGHCTTHLSPADQSDRIRLRTCFGERVADLVSESKTDARLLWDHIAVVLGSPDLAGSTAVRSSTHSAVATLRRELAPQRLPVRGTDVVLEVASGGSIITLPTDEDCDHAQLIVDTATGLALAQVVAAQQDRLLDQAMQIRSGIGRAEASRVAIRGHRINLSSGTMTLPAMTTDKGGLSYRDLSSALEWLAVESGDARNLEWVLSSGLQGPRQRVFRAYLDAWDSPAEMVATQTAQLGQLIAQRHSSTQQAKLTTALNLIATGLATLALVGLVVDLTWLSGSELVEPTQGAGAGGFGLLRLATLTDPNTAITAAAIAALAIVLMISVGLRRWR